MDTAALSRVPKKAGSVWNRVAASSRWVTGCEVRVARLLVASRREAVDRDPRRDENLQLEVSGTSQWKGCTLTKAPLPARIYHGCVGIL